MNNQPNKGEIKTKKKHKRVLQNNLDCPDNGTPEWALMRLMLLASQVGQPTQQTKEKAI
jgi:hypothetical protein